MPRPQEACLTSNCGEPGWPVGDSTPRIFLANAVTEEPASEEGEEEVEDGQAEKAEQGWASKRK